MVLAGHPIALRSGAYLLESHAPIKRGNKVLQEKVYMPTHQAPAT